MLSIDVQTIEHKYQRYPTVGDYWEVSPWNVKFRISNMDNPAYEALVFIHEFVEYVLVKLAGIDLKEIDEFDIQFEDDRKHYKWSNDLEPGHDPRAPYHKQHVFAEIIERAVAFVLGVDWDHYDKTVREL